jgi:hypothetical protein
MVIHPYWNLHHSANTVSTNATSTRGPCATYPNYEFIGKSQRFAFKSRRKIVWKFNSVCIWKKKVSIIGRFKLSVNPQLLDSPGARERSTANIAGCTSKVGKGSSGSTSSSPAPFEIPPIPKTFGLLILPPNLDEEAKRPDDDDDLQGPDPVHEVAEPGAGLEVEGTSELGERIERNPAAEKDEALLCVRCRGDLDGIGDEGECIVDVISILPPPLPERLSNADLTALSVWICSGVGETPETGVIVTVPVSWA